MKNLIMAVLLVMGFNANAGLITVNVSTDEIVLGETIDIDIIATAFAPTDSFNFELIFDTALFDYDNASLQSDLYFSNPFGILEVNAFDGYMGFSFVDFFDVFTGDFTLASFTLTAVANGDTDFSFSSVEFYQGFFNPVFVNSSDIASAKVTQVPEPATWVLLLAAMAIVSRMHGHKSSK